MGGVFPVSEKPDACMSQGWDWNEKGWHLASFEKNLQSPGYTSARVSNVVKTYISHKKDMYDAHFSSQNYFPFLHFHPTHVRSPWFPMISHR